MNTRIRHLTALWLCLVVAAIAAGCASDPYGIARARHEPSLSPDTLLRLASSGPLRAARATLLTGNDGAFRAKIAAIGRAERTIEASYYIYGDDYTSSVFSEALLKAAERGVQVRLLVDYITNYRNLDLFTALERYASAGPGGANGGSIQVRFYNRPTREIVMDAAYLTAGCKRGTYCSVEKLAAITAQFENETIDGKRAADLNISNLSLANSAAFLSGVYGKSPDVAAVAVTSGQNLNADDFKRGMPPSGKVDGTALRQLGMTYAQSRFGGGFEQVAALVRLNMAFALYSENLYPMMDQLNGFLPLERQNATSARDWEYFSDFLHHKLLLVDDRHIVLGGRNIEDSYHMRPNPLVAKYVFMDTDLQAELTEGGADVRAAFDRLWNFRVMVARIDEIKQHAPNDLVANAEARRAAETTCAKQRTLACLQVNFVKLAHSQQKREDDAYIKLRRRAGEYRVRYSFRDQPDTAPSFAVDPGAMLAYVENLPFRGGPGEAPAQRGYGAQNGEEAASGKHIHALWLLRLEQACRSDKPMRVVLHNAYFFPPSNLLDAFGKMIDGRLDCRNVRLTILTNSIQTTDLNVVNVLARQSAKAFVEYAAKARDPARAAQIEYYEYVPTADAARISLHTKVSVFDNDVLVGSANADVRSYMRDTNNGMYLLNAPQLASSYLGHIDQLLADRGRTANMVDYFLNITREEMRRDDRAFYRTLVTKYGAHRMLSKENIDKLEDSLMAMLDQVYDLSEKSVRGDQEAAQAFNRLLKAI